MKEILLSVQPKYCNLIISGQKTIEVRKTRPKSETPFKVYLYKTKETRGRLKEVINDLYGGGKVIGEFVCDRIDIYTFMPYNADYNVTHIELDTMCLNYPNLIDYGKGKTLYGWHISDLKIYDKPKELDEFFHTECTDDSHCDNCPSCDPGYGLDDNICTSDGYRRVTLPPQSWCYVEEL